MNGEFAEDSIQKYVRVSGFSGVQAFVVRTGFACVLELST